MVAACVALTACEEDEITVPPTASVVEVEPRISSVTTGQTVQLTAQPKDAAGNAMSGGTVSWKSLDTLVATVSTSGLVTALSSGSTAIIATTLGQNGSASINAVGVVSAVFITGSTGNLPMGQSVQLQASAREANGRELFRPDVTWASSAPSVATVSATGLVTSVSQGTTTISAVVDGKTGTLAMTILPPPPVATVAIAPNSGYLPTAVGVPLTVTLRDANNGLLTDGRIVTYSTSNAAVATVSSTGVVTAQTPGNVTITATSEGKSGTGTYSAIPGLVNAVGQVIGHATGTSTFYAVYVPAGSTQLQITLRGGTGDPDLYVYRPGQSLTSAAACAGETGGAISETCTMAAPVSGVWVVEVYAWSTFANTTVMAALTPTPP